jgi:hypothetical protein
MGEAVASQVLALELEKVRPNLSLMYQQDDTLWSEFKPKTDVEVVSGRPTRVPMELLAGAKFRVADPDGGDLGLGSGPTTDVGTLTPIYFFQCTQYTKATEINTNQKQKAIESYAELVMKRAMEQFNTNMEAAIQGDGSNTLDTVVSATGSTIVVNNANQFYDNQDIDVWTALGGSNRGTATILSVDAGNKTLYLTAPIPVGTTGGDLLLISGSAGTAGSGIYGVKYFQVNSNTGSVMGLNRASYPGKLSTPTVNAANQAITPAMARRSLGADPDRVGHQDARLGKTGLQHERRSGCGMGERRIGCFLGDPEPVEGRSERGYVAEVRAEDLCWPSDHRWKRLDSCNPRPYRRVVPEALVPR